MQKQKHNELCQESFGSNFLDQSFGRKQHIRYVWDISTNTRTVIDANTKDTEPAVFEEPLYYYTCSISCFCSCKGSPLVSINEELPPLYHAIWLEKYKKK